MKKIKAYAADSKDADLKPYEIERRVTLEDDVKIDILYCGVCHSDLHQGKILFILLYQGMKLLVEY